MAAPNSTVGKETVVVVQEAPATSAVMAGMGGGSDDAKPSVDRISLGLDFQEENPIGMVVACMRECLGTAFFLYFTITMIMFNDETSIYNTLTAAGKTMIAFQFGMCIFVLVYIFADKTGANINPAVSWTLMITKRVSVTRGVGYIIAQCIGATLGAWIARGTNESLFSSHHGGANQINPDISTWSAFLAEMIGAGFLCLTVLHGTAEGYIGKHMGPQLPLAIGMAVFIAHIALIPIDGCSINPARSFGPALVSGHWGGQAVFWFGPLLGSTVAGVSYEMFCWMDRAAAKRESGDVTGAATAAAPVTISKNIEV